MLNFQENIEKSLFLAQINAKLSRKYCEISLLAQINAKLSRKILGNMSFRLKSMINFQDKIKKCLFLSRINSKRSRKY